MKLWILIAVLLLGSTSSAFAAGGTDVVATKGQPAYVSEGWPEGAGELANDPVRTTGWNDWFSEWPNDVNQYALEVQSMEDVNRLVKKLATVKSELKQVRLCPMKEPVGLGWVSSDPEGNKIPVMFSIGDQDRMDQWYAHVRKPFGVIEFEACPVAVPPTLTLFVQNPVIDLDQLKIPAGISVIEGYLPTVFHKSNTKREREEKEKAQVAAPVPGKPLPPEAQAAHDKIMAFLKNHEATASSSAERPAKTLIGTIDQWRYPDAEINGEGLTRMSDGATLRSGQRTCVSSRLETVMTTPDPFEKVVAFYIEKFGITDDESKRVDAPEGGQSVFAQDDSQDRPVQLRVLSVNRDDTATTIVISRATGEKQTHIAWPQYDRMTQEEGQRAKDSR